MSMIYEGETAAKAVGTSELETRLRLNRAYSSADFDQWLLERLAVQPGEDVLDVGCGTGAQTIPFARAVAPGGSVSALDISASSVALVKQRLPAGARAEIIVSDMADLETAIRDHFSVKKYDLVHSSYSLYYATDRAKVLDIMSAALKPGGRCAIFTPNAPHGLVALAQRFTNVPEQVVECMRFGPEFLEPYFRRRFAKVDIHLFHNVVSLPTADDLIEFYRQTTYFDPAAVAPMRAAAEEAIRRDGAFRYEKNGYLIIGRN
jgi:ubiquinone/menaquinone biosynthesis C-methylase UbiE